MKRKREKGNVEQEEGHEVTTDCQMHPRNIFNTPQDFSNLSEICPFLSQYVQGNNFINFKDPYALKALSKALMKVHFKIEWDMPESDNLIPPIPNRVNYIHWIEDLMDQSNSSSNNNTSVIAEKLNQERPSTRGLDIGTGASLIYPLLGVALNPKWTFLATEISQRSVEHANTLIERNNLQSKITVRLSPSPSHILCGVIRDDEKFDFCMCNPPFYSSSEEIGKHPKRIQTGLENELMTTGGEFQFVKQIIDESLVIGQRISWYSSMIGRKDDLKELKKYLFDCGISHVRVTCFVQGKTRRWGVAWSTKGVERVTDLRKNVAVPAHLTANVNSNSFISSSSSQQTAQLKQQKSLEIGWNKSIENLIKELVDCFEAIEIETKCEGVNISCFPTIEALTLCGETAELGLGSDGVIGQSFLSFSLSKQKSGVVCVKIETDSNPNWKDLFLKWINCVEELLELKSKGEL